MTRPCPAALAKELVKSRAMTRIFAGRAAEKRCEGEALIREADNPACQSWDEKIWSDGSPIDPSPTIDQAINGGSRGWCKAKRNVDLCVLRRVPTKCVYDLTSLARLSEVHEGRQAARLRRCSSLCRASGTPQAETVE